MFRWMAYWCWWFGWRAGVTIACIFTIQNVIYQEQEIWINIRPLFIGAMLMILMIQMWSARGRYDKKNTEK